MKSVLKNPEVYLYSNGDHVEFHKLSNPLCNKYATVIDNKSLLSAYDGKVQQEESVFKWIRRSEYTEKKAETDQARDKAYTGITGIVRVNMQNFNPSLRDNALHVHNLLENYGNLKHTDYDAETAAIDSLAARLRSQDYLPAVTALGLRPWLNELEAQNNLFKSYVNDTAQEQVDKPGIVPKAARRETDDALHRITARVSALANLNGPDDYAAFAEEFNILVNHYNTLVHEHYGRLHARIDISSADIAPISVQPFTGKPVYVIPSVTLRKTSPDGSTTIVELAFSQDFTIACRNNVGPGTATLSIKGLGRYVGELVTTFNIE
jgi:hypothetical protein